MSTIVSWRLFGVLVGALIGIALTVVFMIFINKNRKLKTEYDERQELQRGRGFKLGFIGGMVYVAILMILSIAEVKLPMVTEVTYFSIIFVMSLLMASYNIFVGAYFGINSSPTRFYAVMAVITVINFVVPLRFMIDGTFIQEGQVTLSGVNLLCGLMFLIIGIECVIKKAIDGKAGGEDEES